MKLFWFRSGYASQEVGYILKENIFDMGLIQVYCDEKKRDYLIFKEEITVWIEK